MSDNSSGKRGPQMVFVVDGIPTLPLYVMWGVTQETIQTFAEGKIKPEYVDPDYQFNTYDLSRDCLKEIESDPKAAKTAVYKWIEHRNRYAYYIQFQDDLTRQKIQALHAHTKLISALCDARFAIDTAELWRLFDCVPKMERIYAKYRADKDRELNYDKYAGELASTYEEIESVVIPATRLIGRIATQIDLNASIWPTLKPLYHPEAVRMDGRKVRIFYSYSHRDTALRDKLEDHLGVFKRNGLIEGWHDRKIGAGNEWKGVIDDRLEAADLILLLVSSNFLNSDYCYDVEMKRAMERHENQAAKVVPIILRPCVWTDAPFGKIQALPKDAKAVTSWNNKDEAFSFITKELSNLIRQMTR